MATADDKVASTISTRTTFAPREPRCFPMANPIPLAPPVTKATCLEKSDMLVWQLLSCLERDFVHVRARLHNCKLQKNYNKKHRRTKARIITHAGSCISVPPSARLLEHSVFRKRRHQSQPCDMHDHRVSRRLRFSAIPPNPCPQLQFDISTLRGMSLNGVQYGFPAIHHSMDANGVTQQARIPTTQRKQDATTTNDARHNNERMQQRQQITDECKETRSDPNSFKTVKISVPCSCKYTIKQHQPCHYHSNTCTHTGKDDKTLYLIQVLLILSTMYCTIDLAVYTVQYSQPLSPNSSHHSLTLSRPQPTAHSHFTERL